MFVNSLKIIIFLRYFLASVGVDYGVYDTFLCTQSKWNPSANAKSYEQLASFLNLL
jgi:hypothetical protein